MEIQAVRKLYREVRLVLRCYASRILVASRAWNNTLMFSMQTPQGRVSEN
jgi:hypothetical protein